MSKYLAGRFTRMVTGDVLKDMMKECVRFQKDNGGLRPDRVLLPADQFDRLCAALDVKQMSFPDIHILEKKLGFYFDGGAPIGIQLMPNDKLEAVEARARQIIEPPKKSTKLILPKGVRHG